VHFPLGEAQAQSEKAGHLKGCLLVVLARIHVRRVLYVPVKNLTRYDLSFFVLHKHSRADHKPCRWCRSKKRADHQVLQAMLL
jgi:hypothetical protein